MKRRFPELIFQFLSLGYLIHVSSTRVHLQEGKIKVHPTTGHEGPEGEYTYSSTLSLTSAIDGVGGKRHAPAALPPGKDMVPFVLEAGWTSGPVRTGAENLAPHRDSITGPSSPWQVAIPTELSRPVIFRKTVVYEVMV